MKVKRKTTRKKASVGVDTKKTPKRKKSDLNDYIDSAKFSKAVIEFVEKHHLAIQKELEPPRVSDYIASSFLLICENLSHRPNFVGYTYREDMVMDAVENCLRAIASYNPNYKSKAGYKINAFNYFTTVAYWAMVRRIQKENKDVKLKNKIIDQSVMLEFFTEEGVDNDIARQYVDQLRNFNMKE